MAEKQSPVTYHEYNLPSVNKLFAWSAVGLLIASVWMIWADYDRDWKDYQRRFNDVEIARTQQAITDVEGKIDQGNLGSAQARVDQATQALAAQRAEEERLEDQLAEMYGRWYAADQAYKFRKADLDVVRFELDEALHAQHGVEAARSHFDAVVADVDARRLAFEQLDAEKAGIESQLATLRADLTAATKDLDALLADKNRLEKRLGTIEHSLVKDWFRDQPLVDFLAPTLKVQQTILPNLHEDVNFMSVPRVDRCHTCHQAIDKAGYTEETLAPEFRSHPRLDTLIGNHPVDQFGCTGCHSGGPRALTFSDAAHTPQNPEQKAEWERDHDWHRMHHWDYPMLPLQYAEAGCGNCHSQETRVPGAEVFNAGRDLIENYGCFGCHKINRTGFDELRKVGPELGHITAKVSKDWLYKWLEYPKSFRPTTRMPRFWGNSNTQVATETMDYPLRDKVEIEAVVRYLMSKSAPYGQLAEPKGTGNVERGRWLVENRGCQGCHVVGEGDTGEGRPMSAHGPDLNQVGSKLNLRWTYNWIKDPAALWPDTRMPNLRLTDQEALDAAAYLMTLDNPAFDAAPIADLTSPASQQMLETVTLEYLRKEATLAESDSRLAAMNEEQRYQYLGSKAINRYGCFGCHPGISGFESAQPIGVELTTWASRLITQLDFGLQKDMPHTRHDWLRAKLANPRVYDEDKVEGKHPQDLLRMPNFEFSDDELNKLVTAVMSFSKDLVQPLGHRRLDAREAIIERGRRVVRDHNCQGCHVIENVGGGLASVVEGGIAFAPPVLEAEFAIDEQRKGYTRQGAKVKPDWFFHFLKEPTTIRPWLNVRMPTFSLDDEQANAIVHYFAALAEEPYPYDSFDRADLDPVLVRDGQTLFNQKSCINCHLPLEQARALGVKEEELAPNLELTKSRLKYDWLQRWLKDPGAIQEGTKMPSFFYYYDEDDGYVETTAGAEGEIDRLRGYLQYHGDPMPAPRTAAAGR